MKRSFLLAVALAMFSTVSMAAEPTAVEERKGASFNEVERGFFLGVNAGFWGTINPPALTAKERYFSPGQAVQVEIGGDIGERVSLAAFFLATTNKMGSDYFGLNSTHTASGDYGSIAPGVTGKFRLVGFKDSQDVKRTWIYVRVQGAVMFYTPAGLKLPLDVMLAGGPGVEYFTRLRHFSIGVEANFNFMALTGSLGFSILPSVRYAF